MGHPVLTVVGAVPHGLAVSPAGMNSLAASRGRAAPGMSFVRHDAPGMWKWPAEIYALHGRGTGALRSGLWQGCSMEELPCFIWHGVGGGGQAWGRKMVFRDEKTAGGKGKTTS